jgi:hypothetical protein
MSDRIFRLIEAKDWESCAREITKASEYEIHFLFEVSSESHYASWRLLANEMTDVTE